MQDRLADLQRAPAPVEDEPGDLEAGNRAAEQDFMAQFFEEVSTVKSKMKSMKSNIAMIEQKHGQTLTDVYGGKQFKEELEDLTDGTNRDAAQVRNALKKMDGDNKEFEHSSGPTAESRIRTNMQATLTRKFMDLMQDYQGVQTKYKDKYKETVERQYKIVNPDATEDEVKEVLDGNSDHIFTDHMLSTGHAQAKTALADIQERHKDITRLEQSITELHQLFVDLSILVEAQGELLDSIEYSVGQSLNYTKTGVEELEKANYYAKKSRKKMCILIVIAIVVLSVILGPILMDSGGSV